MKLGPHLHRLGNDAVASYLIDTADGITLIDAALPRQRDPQSGPRCLGRAADDIRGTLPTHGDSGRIGCEASTVHRGSHRRPTPPGPARETDPRPGPAPCAWGRRSDSAGKPSEGMPCAPTVSAK